MRGFIVVRFSNCHGSVSPAHIMWFRAGFTEEPEEIIVVAAGIWCQSGDQHDLPSHVKLVATVKWLDETRVWELTCFLPPEATKYPWLIAHAQNDSTVLGCFPVYDPAKAPCVDRPLPKPVQLISTQPQPKETDIVLYAVQATNNDDFALWLRCVKAYVACELTINPQEGQHCLLVRTLPSRSDQTLHDSAFRDVTKFGNMMLCKTDTASLLSRTPLLYLTLRVVLWEFSSTLTFYADDLARLLQSREQFIKSLPDPICGDIEKPLQAHLPASVLCGHLLFMAYRTICCIANGCETYHCLAGISNSQGVIKAVKDNLCFLATEDLQKEFISAPRNHKDLFYALVLVALQLQPVLNEHVAYIQNARSLLKLYLP